MKTRSVVLLFGVIMLLFNKSCAPPAQEIEIEEKRNVELSLFFEEVLSINLDNCGLSVFTPSTTVVKGVFGDNKENYALYDYSLKECALYTKKGDSLKSIFEIPKHPGWGEAHLLEVVSEDSILYFDFEHQSLVTCTTKEVMETYNLSFDKNQHPYLIIQHLHQFLRSIDGYIGFNTWINYGEGGQNVDYDLLMDQRDMVCFFKVLGDSVLCRDVPIKPFLKKTTFPDLMYIDNPFFEVNLHSREILVFHLTTDTVYTFGWDTEQVQKHIISGSEIELIPPKVTRRGTSVDVKVMYENQERGHHRIYSDIQSGKYIRRLIKEFPIMANNGLPPRQDIRLLQVLSSDFKVEFEMELPEGYDLMKRVDEGIYLRKSDDETREFTLYQFEWKK